MRGCSSVAWGTYVFFFVCVLVEWKGVWGWRRMVLGGGREGGVSQNSVQQYSLCLQLQVP